MRGVAERSVECIISLLRRLDLLAQEEWGDFGKINSIILIPLYSFFYLNASLMFLKLLIHFFHHGFNLNSFRNNC